MGHQNCKTTQTFLIITRILHTLLSLFDFISSNFIVHMLFPNFETTSVENGVTENLNN